MPSFDVVCDPNIQEIDNAVNQAGKEVQTRWDLKGGKNSIEWDKKEITITAEMKEKLEALKDILHSKLIKRGVPSTALNYGKEDPGSMGSVRLKAGVKKGLDKESAKKVTTKIKDTKLKVQAQIMDDKVRVTAKSIDDLQEVMAVLRESGFDFPISFENMKRD